MFAFALLLASHGAPDARRALALPEVRFGELVDSAPAALQRVRAALVEYGAFALVDVPRLGEATAEALGALPACTRGQREAAVAAAGGVEPLRTTVAARSTAGVAGDDDLGACAPSLRSLRALVGASTAAVAGAIDAGFGETMAREDGGAYGFAQLAAEGEQLEHFHLYSVQPDASPARARAADEARGDDDDDARWTLPVHTDAGLLAVMTAGFYMPADPLEAATHAPPPADGGLFLRLRSGELVRVAQAAADAPRPSLLVFAGEGAASWLRGANGSATAIRAAPHALRVGTHPADALGALARGWHGRMVLPPPDALLPPRTGPRGGRGATGLSFGKHWLAEAERAARNPAPTAPSTCAAHATLPAAAPRADDGARAATTRRRLHNGEEHAEGSHVCTTANGKAGIKCWMTCMDVSALACPAARARCYDAATALANGGGEHCAKTCAPACDAVDRGQMIGLVVGLIGGVALLLVGAVVVLYRRKARLAAAAGAGAKAAPAAAAHA